MRRLWHILVKEFLQLVRTPEMIFILVICPVVIVGIVPVGLANEPHIRAEVVDDSFSGRGSEVMTALAGSPAITRLSRSASLRESMQRMTCGETDVIVEVPQSGECRIIADATQTILARDAVYSVGRQLSSVQADDRVRFHSLFVSEAPGHTHYYIVTMLTLLLAVTCALPLLSVVREMERKNLEQLRSTGMSALLYVYSKVLFFSLVGLCELAAGLVIARYVYSLSVAGPLADIFLLGACFLFAIVNLNLLIAAVSRRLVRAVYILVFVYIILIMLGTMFAPLDNMSPLWAATRYANPFFWMVDGGWKIMLRGFSVADNPENGLALLGIGMLLSGLNVRLFKRID